MGIHVYGGTALGMYQIDLPPAQHENLTRLISLMVIVTVATSLFFSRMMRKRQTEE